MLHTKEGTHCFIHVFPYYTNNETIFSGVQIGEVYDGTQLHFKKYGDHSHYFPPSNEEGENEFSSPVNIRKLGESPDVLYSIDLITRFTFSAFDVLMTYKTLQ